MYLPGHSPSLHVFFSDDSPKHGFPPPDAGVDIVRVRVVSPSPHETEHLPQSLKSPHTQSTKVENSVMYNWNEVSYVDELQIVIS